jgi:hypothetical protein
MTERSEHLERIGNNILKRYRRCPTCGKRFAFATLDANSSPIALCGHCGDAYYYNYTVGAWGRYGATCEPENVALLEECPFGGLR